MQKTCEGCGQSFEAKRASAKYCPATRDRCKKRAQRAPKLASVVDLPPPEAGEPDEPSDAERYPLTAMTTRELDQADRLATGLGVALVQLALRIDRAAFGVDTGSSYAALTKEYRAARAEALKDAETENDPVEEIRRAAALKRIS